MKSIAVIAEFNPFHNGHAHLLKMIRREFGSDATVTAIMSGWYVQRGDLAVANPYTRAEMALRAGYDLVLELPFPYSISSAKDFATAGVSLAEHLACFDILAFGSESCDLPMLTRLAEIRASKEFEQIIDHTFRATEEGRKMGFPHLAREALRQLSGDQSLQLGPNDTLAIEYICALRDAGSSIRPYPIKRIGDSYESTSPEHPSITSAGAIRPLLQSDNVAKMDCYIGAESADPLLRDLDAQLAPAHLSHRLSDAVLAFFIALSESDLSRFERDDPGEGELVRRIALAARDSLDLDDLLSRVSTKSLTDAYVRRVLLRTFLGVTSSETRSRPLYTRVLGFSDRGRTTLRIAKRNGSVSLLTKTADYSLLPAPAADQAARSLAADCFCFMAMPQSRPASDAYRGTPRHIPSVLTE